MGGQRIFPCCKAGRKYMSCAASFATLHKYRARLSISLFRPRMCAVFFCFSRTPSEGTLYVSISLSRKAHEKISVLWRGKCERSSSSGARHECAHGAVQAGRNQQANTSADECI